MDRPGGHIMEDGFVNSGLKRLPGIEKRHAGSARVFNRREAGWVARAGVKAVSGVGETEGGLGLPAGERDRLLASADCV